MVYDNWFEVEEGLLSPAQAAMVDIVRASAREWPQCPPSSAVTLVFSPDEEEDDEDEGGSGDGNDAYDAAWDAAYAAGESVVLLIVDVLDVERNRRIRTLGATVAGDRLFCGERHDTTYRPHPSDDIEPLEATGAPEELGRLAADWFGEVVRRPVLERDRSPWPRRFVPPGTPLPPGHRWARNGPSAAAR